MDDIDDLLVLLADAEDELVKAKNRLNKIQALSGGTATAQAENQAPSGGTTTAQAEDRLDKIQALSGGTTTVKNSGVEMFKVEEVVKYVDGHLLGWGMCKRYKDGNIRECARKHFEGKKSVTAEEILEFAKTVGEFKHDDGTLENDVSSIDYERLKDKRMNDFLKFLRE